MTGDRYYAPGGEPPTDRDREILASWRQAKASRRVGLDATEAWVMIDGERWYSLGIPDGVSDPHEPVHSDGLTSGERRYLAAKYEEDMRPKPGDAEVLSAWLANRTSEGV